MSSKRNITYKCPYCDKRFNKENLVIHVGNKHDDMIPEGYSAFRVVFDYINKKPAGYNGKCIICGKESGWDEDKGKYNRLCDNSECKKKYVKSFEDRMMKTNGVTRISSTAEGQAKMLANRKISGEYKFQDGGIKTYTGTYEKKTLEFMDKVMNIKSEDVTTPGPIMEYMFEGKKHIYISDIYYAPYNLIIEVKDGGNNPNMRSMPEYRAKQIAKEKWIIKNTDFNYLRLTNNDFSQLLAVFMELKMEMSNDTPERVIRINEGQYIDNEAKWIDDGDCFICSKCGKAYGWTSIDQLSNFCPECGRKMIAVIKESKEYNPSFKSDEDYIEEGFLKSKPDILYNKEAFDNGDINLCFVTGFSGSGKSTLAHSKESNETEAYELDDILWNHRFSDDNLKEYGDLIYSYFKGPGKKYRVHNKDEFKKLFRSAKENDETSNVNGCTKEFIDHVKEFVKYSINYSKSHKNKKYIIEGIYLYMFFEPSYFKDYAFYIKGTSLLKSTKRALKRDWENNKSNGDKLSKRIDKANNKIYHTMKNINYDNRLIDKFIKYFKDKPETILGESYIEERSIRGDVMLYHGSVDGTYKTIENNSINNGNRFEKSRTSSFWFIKKEYAEMFATAELICDKSNKEIPILIDNDMKTLVDEKYKSSVINWLTKYNCYVYSKLINGRYVSGGQGRNFPEYTVDFPVKPDNVSKVSFESKINSVKFVSRSYIDSTIEKYKKNKMNYGNSLFGQMIDNILYNSHQNIIQNKRDIKRFNETNLYHGSHYDIKGYIEPKNNSYENGNYVFATNDRSFALCYSGNPWHDDIINQSYYNGQLVITEMKPGYLDKVFNTDGYIYTINKSDIKKFTQQGYSKYISTEKVLYSNKEYISNILKEMKNSNIEIYKYPNKPSWMNKNFNEDYIEEGFLKSEPDILYNKEAFDNGDINICFVTGLSGSGKSTLSHSQESDTVEVYELDDLSFIKDRFTMNDLRKYGDLIYSYFNGPGKEFYKTYDEVIKENIPGSDYEDKLIPGFIDYAIKWAKSHKNKKYIIEGIWIFTKDEHGKPYFEPSYFKNYAFYIKGTSILKSKIRADIRDSKDAGNGFKRLRAFAHEMINRKWKWYIADEKEINKFRDYFKNKPETVLSEAMSWKESDDKIESIKKIYYGLTESESKKKFLVYKGKNKGVNATLEGLIKFLKDNDMQDTITKYVILDIDQFNIDYNIKYDEKYDMFCIKTPFEFEIKNPKDINYSISESKNASVIEDDFKKKSGKSFKLIDLNTKEALKYVSDKWQTAYRNTRFGRIVVCKEDDKLSGYIYWNKSGTIGPLEVYNDYRGYGLSEILMKEAIKNGGNKLGVYSDNEVAIRLYKKLGFIETGRKKYKDGDEVIIMELKSSLNEAYTGELGKIQRDPEIIDSYGFISSDGIYNENVKIKGFNKWLRGRSELLILDGDKLYLKKDPKKGYSIPGGGWEKDEDHNLSAIRETNEEARIKVKNVNYVSSYVAYFPPKDWVKEKISEENWWYGEYIELYIGEYDGQYKGKVEKIDQDKAMESGKFYDIKSIYNDLIPVHQEALSDIVNEASTSDYKFLDIKSNKSKALEYLKANSETKSYAEDTIKNYNGELVIYNDIMIGRILVGDKKDKGFITDFSIDEEHRGIGLGSKLIDDAINKYHGIDLLVDKDNKLAIDMYKKRGFIIVKTYKNQYYMKLESKLKEDTNMMNEAMNALLTGYIPGSVDNPNNTYIVNYMQNNVFSGEDPNEGIGVSDNPKFTNLIIRDKDGILKRVDESFLDDKTYKVYIIELSKEEVSNRLSKYMGESVEKGFIYETLLGKKLYTNDQIQFESKLVPTMDYYESMDTFKEICDNYFFARDKKEESINESTFIPKEVRYFNNSGLMYSDKVYTLEGYINSKPNKVLECLDITIKE